MVKKKKALFNHVLKRTMSSKKLVEGEWKDDVVYAYCKKCKKSFHWQGEENQPALEGCPIED